MTGSSAHIAISTHTNVRPGSRQRLERWRLGLDSQPEISCPTVRLGWDQPKTWRSRCRRANHSCVGEERRPTPCGTARLLLSAAPRSLKKQVWAASVLDCAAPGQNQVGNGKRATVMFRPVICVVSDCAALPGSCAGGNIALRSRANCPPVADVTEARMPMNLDPKSDPTRRGAKNCPLGQAED